MEASLKGLENKQTATSGSSIFQLAFSEIQTEVTLLDYKTTFFETVSQRSTICLIVFPPYKTLNWQLY